MPEANGLVHKGVALSGSMISATQQEYSSALGSFIMQEVVTLTVGSYDHPMKVTKSQLTALEIQSHKSNLI
jgi:carboxylesterase type B